MKYSPEKTTSIRQSGRFDHRGWLKGPLWLLVMGLLFMPLAAPAQVFWSVTDNAGRQNWILGTLHSEDPRLLDWPQPLVDALQKADRLALELKPDEAMAERLKQAMTCREQSLADRLPAPLFERLLAVLENDYRHDRNSAAQLCLWAAALTLAAPPPASGMYMDMMLAWRGQGAGLELVALETVDEQIEFLSGLPDADQVVLIEKALDERDSHDALFNELVKTYLEGDLEQLTLLSNRQLEGLPVHIANYFNEQGLEERNRRMLERARPWLEQGGLIIAVGALHLPGEDGLLALLANEGWQLQGIY
ncbi:MAG TPA: TraB/GumN family protein [Wenzhouxiangella sp.]|nr:TraB/GumN family protein [Wenzhouxiangella sp.]